MKLIFDIGCNEGQNLDYFLKKGDVVVGIEADPQLVKKINSTIRAGCSPRHVPHIVLETEDIPYTINGKKVEIAVKRIIDGEKITNKDALSNPESLKLFENIPELQ